jgi:hypothetical protein
MNWDDSQAWDWMTSKKSVWDNKSPAEIVVKGDHSVISEFIADLNDDVLSKLLKIKGDFHE